MQKVIQLSVSGGNEGTDSPYWLILDPKQNMGLDIHLLAHQITGPFFSRTEAEQHLRARSYEYSSRACVYCLSGYWSSQYKWALRTSKSSDIEREVSL